MGHVENLFSPPHAARGEEKRLMELESSREDGAPKVCHCYNGGNALGYILVCLLVE